MENTVSHSLQCQEIIEHKLRQVHYSALPVQMVFHLEFADQLERLSLRRCCMRESIMMSR